MDKKIKIRDKTEISKDIERLVRSPGYIYALSNTILMEEFVPIDQASEVNWRERLSLQELTYLTCLLAKQAIDFHLVDEKKMLSYIKQTHELLEELHWSFNAPFMKELSEISKGGNKNDDEKRFLSDSSMMVEAILYSGTGAFDFQYANFSKSKYDKDKLWLLENKNFDIEKVNEIAFFLKNLFQEKFKNSFKGCKRSKDFSKMALETLCFSRKELKAKFSDQEISTFLEFFSVNPGEIDNSFLLPTDHNIIDYKPILKLEDEKYLLPVGFNLFRSIYESPYYWMSQDKSYLNIASKHRGESTEEIAYSLLKEVFGAENIHTNVSIGKSKHKLISEVDVIAIQGNKAIIVQAKSKKLTLLSRGGDAKSLETDFNEAVQKAYDQGLICRNAILAKDNFFFDDKKNKIELSEKIQDVYILCLTSDYHSSVQHQARAYLKKEAGDPYPIPLSIFDLELICFYLKDPYELLYYLRQRINLSDYVLADEEIVYLGFHLRNKLFKKKGFDLESLDNSFGQPLEVDFCVKKGDFPYFDTEEKLYSKWKNEKFKLLIEQVKLSQDAGFTDAIFFLYDLAGEAADELIAKMEQIIQKSNKDGRNHDMTLVLDNGDSGVSFACKSNSQFRNELINLCVARKYKTKANQWLGLGKFLGSNKMVDCIAYSNEPWCYDRKLENFSKMALRPGAAVNLKKIGRNEKCPCGSGSKYKKCCGR